MVARPGSYQASNNAGEVMPELHGRTDVKQFYSALAYALNVEPVPQGGSRLAQRTRHLSRIRRKLIEVDGTPTATLGPFTNPATIISMDLGSLRTFCRIVLPNFSASVQLGQILQFDYLDPMGFWTKFWRPFSAGPDVGTLTIALPPGEIAIGSVIRLRMVSAPPSSVTFTADEIAIAAEGSDISAVKVRPFTFSLDQTYTSVFTEDHVDFFRDGVYVGAAETGLVEVQLTELDTPQRFDTMLMFDQDVAQQRVLRNGADNEWVRSDIEFSNIPQVDLGGDYTNGVVNVWVIYLRYPTTGAYANGANLFMSVKIGDEETAGVGTGAANWSTFKDAVKAAIEGLPSVSPGITVTEDHSTSGLTTITVTFSGSGNEGEWGMTAQVVNTADAAATVTETTIGKLGGEPLFSDARGYPACGKFYQDRLIQGGFLSKGAGLLASETGEYFDLNIEATAASAAILLNLDTDGSERLHKLAQARHLVMFTTDGEYFISDRALSKTVVPTIVACSRNGSALGVPIAESEGSLFYLSPDREDPARKGIVLYAMVYDDIATAYVSTPQSLLASHIVKGVIGQALQHATDTSDANKLWMVRDDGTMTTCVMIRNQDVSAFVRWWTSGNVRDICVDGKNRPQAAIERIVNGVPELHLERLEHGLIFDDVVEYVFDAPTMTVDRLDMHEGEQVWALVDGYVDGPFTVTDNTITLSQAGLVVSVGRWTPPIVDTLPMPDEIAERIVLKRKKRVHTVRLDLLETTSVAVGANGQPPADLPLYRAGDPTDAPLAPFSGIRAAEGLVGFTDTGQVRITQTKPGQLQWRGITIEARK